MEKQAVQETIEQGTTLPVSQLREVIGYGGFATFFGYGVVSQSAELITSGGPTLEHIATGPGARAAVTVMLGYGAVRAFKETRAYWSSTEEEQEAPETIERRIDVERYRTVISGAITAGGAAIAVAATTRATKDQEAARAVVGALSGGGGYVAARMMLSSHRKVNKFKEQLEDLTDNR